MNSNICGSGTVSRPTYLMKSKYYKNNNQCGRFLGTLRLAINFEVKCVGIFYSFKYERTMLRYV